MKNTVSYLLLPSGKKLVSWHIHDLKIFEEDGIEYMIDGGQDSGYTRYSDPDNKCEFKNDTIEDSISWIRDSFKWGVGYDKNNKRLSETKEVLLKDLDTTHIEKILELDKVKGRYIEQFFKEELKYRKNIETNK